MIRHSSITAILAGTALTLSAGTTQAQPADRPAAFISAIAAAEAQSSGWIFYEAELENDDGDWLFNVEFVSANAGMLLEHKLDAFSFAFVETETKSPSPGKQAELQAILNLLPQATVGVSQAITTMSSRTPEGTQLFKVERGIEHSAPAFEFYYTDGVSEQELYLDATDGSAGGGNPPPPPPPMGGVTLNQVIGISLTAQPGSRIIEVEFHATRGKWEVRLITPQGVARELDISAATGAIISNDEDPRSDEEYADDRLVLNGVPGATITLVQAMQLAAAAAPGSTPIKAEWEYEGSKLVAKVVVQDAAGLRTLLFNAVNGASTTPAPPVTITPGPAPIVSMGQAAAAGAASVAGSTAIEVEYETEGGRPLFEVKVVTTNPLKLRKVVVDARTGAVLGKTVVPMSPGFQTQVQTVLARASQATVSFGEAEQAALTVLGDGRIREIELKPKSGSLAYEVNAMAGQKEFRLTVDAASGAVRPR